MRNYPYVFISYSTIDGEIADSIATLLEALGISYFLDRKEIQWGDRFEGTIRKQIGDCSHLIVIVSPASVQSPWVPYEVGQARALNKILLPYLTHPSINLPSFLANLHYVSELESIRTFFEKLARTQGKRRQQRAVPRKDKTASDSKGNRQQEPIQISAYLNQSDANLPELIRAARRAIDILAITLESSSELLPELTNALKHNCELRLRVLLMDPDSSFTSGRANQLSIVRGAFREEARASLEKLVHLFAECPGQAELRLYDALPTQMSFRFDDVLVVSVYSTTRPSRQLVHLRFAEDMLSINETFLQHFEILWAGASVPRLA